MMRHQSPRGGRIINFSDWVARSGRPRYPGYLSYYVAKAGVAALTEALALEPNNARMLALAVGAIEHRGAMGWPPFGPDDRERCADLARRGLAVVVVSSYLPELLGLADRVVVLREGAVAGELPGGASEEDVLRLASGGVDDPADHLHGVPPLRHDPRTDPVTRQNIEEVPHA